MTRAGTSRAAATRLPARHTAVAIGNEVSKGLVHGWAERWQIAFETAMFAAIPLLLAALVGRGEAIIAGRFTWELDPQRTAWLFVGFAGFTFYYLHAQKWFWRLLGEIQAGTLEQVYLTPLPTWIVAAAGRVAAGLAETAVVVVSLYVAVRAVVAIGLHWNWDVLVALAGLIVASVGYSLLIGGLTLRLKRIEILNDGLHVAVLFLGGIMVSLDQLPAGMAMIGRYLPITHPVEGLRTTLVDGASLAMGGHGGLVWIVATALGWLVLGAVTFQLGDTSARRTATLNRA